MPLRLFEEEFGDVEDVVVADNDDDDAADEDDDDDDDLLFLLLSNVVKRPRSRIFSAGSQVLSLSE